MISCASHVGTDTTKEKSSWRTGWAGAPRFDWRKYSLCVSGKITPSRFALLTKENLTSSLPSPQPLPPLLRRRPAPPLPSSLRHGEATRTSSRFTRQHSRRLLSSSLSPSLDLGSHREEIREAATSHKQHPLLDPALSAAFALFSCLWLVR